MGDDYERLRRRRDDSRRARPPGAAAGSPAFIGKVFARSAVPTTTGRFFAVHPVAILGAEAEGGAATTTVDTSATVLVYVAGGKVPVAGDLLVCRFVGHRWVADPLKGAGGPGCDCPGMPSGPVVGPGRLATLAMTSSNHTAAGGMFEDDTFTYGPTPSGYAGLSMAAYTFLSDHSFADQFGGSFRYYFYCQRNQFFLTRVYLSSIFGSPFEDSTRYNWTTGFYGNTCGTGPGSLSLTSGRIYAGGDTTIIVQVTG